MITAPYISRVLEPDGVGLFNFANTYAMYFALFAALGIPVYGIREIAKIRNDRAAQQLFVSEIISISIIVTVIFTILMLGSLIIIPNLRDNYKVFVTAGIVLYLTPFKTDWFFSGKEEFGYIAFRSITIKTLSVMLLFILVRSKHDLIIYVFLSAASQSLNDLWNYIKIYRAGIHPYFILSGRRHIKPLLILMSSAVAISIYSGIDTLMLGFITDYREVGYYESATHVTKAFLPIVTSLATVVLPRIAQYVEQERWEEISSLINKSISIVLFVATPIVFGLIIIAPSFVPLFFSDQFEGTILPLQILSLTLLSIGLSNIAGVQVLLGLGKDRLYLYSILIGGVVSLGINSLLIPLYGSVGAALTSTIAETTVMLMMSYYVYISTNIRVSISRELFIDLIISVPFIIIGIVLSKFISGWLFVVVCLFFCASFYLVAQYIVGNTIEKAIFNIVMSRFDRSK